MINDPTNLAAYEELGIPAAYLPHAYRPSVHYPRTGPRDPERASDFVFIGTAFASRIRFLEAMNLDGIDTLIGGSWWPTDTSEDSPLRKFFDQDEDKCIGNDETAELYRNAKMSLNYYRREGKGNYDGGGWSMGPREVELASTRLFFLRDPRPEGDKLFQGILPTFDSPGDASEQLRWWLSHDRQREQAADLARRAVQDRTFTANARRLLTMLDRL